MSAACNDTDRIISNTMRIHKERKLLGFIVPYYNLEKEKKNIFTGFPLPFEACEFPLLAYVRLSWVLLGCEQH